MQYRCAIKGLVHCTLSNQNVAAKQIWPDICKLLSIIRKLNLSEDLFVDTCLKILARKTLKFLAPKMT